MSPSLAYIAAVLAVGFLVTVSLRAVPFIVLEPLRQSRFVRSLATWMPVGILGILALTTFADSAGFPNPDPKQLWAAVAAATTTVVTHFWARRKTLVSVGAGTLVFVLLVNLL